MNIYKEIEKLTEFHQQQLKQILDALPLFEVVDRTPHKLVVRQESRNCISMKDLLKNWEMVEEDDGLIIFSKISDSDKTHDDNKYND